MAVSKLPPPPTKIKPHWKWNCLHSNIETRWPTNTIRCQKNLRYTRAEFTRVCELIEHAYWDRIVTRDVHEVLSTWEEKMYVYELLSNWEEKMYEEEYIQGKCSPYKRHSGIAISVSL